MIFVLISLLVHVLVFGLILCVTRLMPGFVPKPEPTAIHLTMIPPPPPPAPPQQKPIFIPTTPQANVVPKKQPIISANDTDLTTVSRTARNPESIMPDVQGKEHAPNLNNTPNVQSPPKPQVESTPPTPKSAQPEKPTPPQPNPAPPTPVPPQPKTVQPQPKPTPPKPTPPKPQPQVDDNGLPVLPQINAPTMAQANPALASPPPAISQPQEASSIHGSIGRQGDNSPAAMASALGKYKQKFFAAVGSRWYPKIDNSFSIIGVGQVRIQYTIHSDGTVDTKVLDGGNSSMQTLLSISLNSIRETSPFDPFPPELIKELISTQGGDGSSYTDDFTFSVY
jgi:outer membrane biosynthesis protein TonB